MIPALLIYRGGVNVREAGRLDAPARFMTAAGDYALAVGVSGPDGQGFRWVEGDFGERGQGWTRADVTFAVGDFSLLGGGKTDAMRLAGQVFPAAAPVESTVNNLDNATVGEGQTAAKWAAPVGEYTITQGYGVNGHRGVDLAGPVGSAICAPAAATVYRVLECAKCRPDAPNLSSQGIAYNAAIGSDLSWGYGFGHAVVLKIARAAWPDAAQAAYPDLNFAYLTFGHLRDSPPVTVGQIVGAGTAVGARGMTGNASGPHLHLQVALSRNGQAENPFDGADVVIVDPGAFYRL